MYKRQVEYIDDAFDGMNKGSVTFDKSKYVLKSCRVNKVYYAVSYTHLKAPAFQVLHFFKVLLSAFGGLLLFTGCSLAVAVCWVAAGRYVPAGYPYSGRRPR